MTRWPPDVFSDRYWLMSLGERAALEGLLAQLRPELAIEIGTGDGAGLQRIAAHSQEVHSLDLVARWSELPSNVDFHLGDSRVVLPEVLGQLADQGRNVDFVLVDGDHSAEGVRSDVENLLGSAAIGRTVIVLHDTLNEDVRHGIAGVPFDGHPHVRYVDLDFVPGFMVGMGPFAGQLWGGLGLVVVDANQDIAMPEQYCHDTPTMLRLGARKLRWRPLLAPLRAARNRLGSRSTKPPATGG